VQEIQGVPNNHTSFNLANTILCLTALVGPLLGSSGSDFDTALRALLGILVLVYAAMMKEHVDIKVITS
jgi:hypothetical protein